MNKPQFQLSNFDFNQPPQNKKQISPMQIKPIFLPLHTAIKIPSFTHIHYLLVQTEKTTIETSIHTPANIYKETPVIHIIRNSTQLCKKPITQKQIRIHKKTKILNSTPQDHH